MVSKRLFYMTVVTTLLLLFPLIAMQFTTEVNWTVADFILAAVLLFGTMLLIEFGINSVQSKNYSIVIILGILALLFIFWAELAVGIFDTL